MDEKRCLLEKRSEVGSSAEHWSRLHAGASEVRMSANGSNPAHGDAIRRGVATQSAEVFALPLWVARARWGSPIPYLSPLRVYQGYLLRKFSGGLRPELKGGSRSRRPAESM